MSGATRAAINRARRESDDRRPRWTARLRAAARWRAFPQGALCLALLALAPALAHALPEGEARAYRERFDAMLADLDDPQASFEFVKIAVRTGDLRGAVAALERILKIQPDLSNIKLELGLLYLRLGSPQLAAHYTGQVLQDPTVPDWVRTRAKVLLAQAQQATSRHFISGTLYGGGRYDSNANAGPDSRFVRVFDPIAGSTTTAQLRPEDTGQSDYSAELSGSLSYVYALDSQVGNQVEVDVVTYNRRYLHESRVNVSTLGVDVGPRLYFGPINNPDFSVKPFLSASQLWLDSDAYRTSLGGGVNLRKTVGLNVLTQASFAAYDQDYSDTTRQSAADDRSGPFYVASGKVSYLFLSSTRLSFGLDAASRDANEDYDAYDEWGGRFTLTHNFASPYGMTAGRWSVSLTGSVHRTEYDEGDPVIDPQEAREDTRYNANLSLSIPLRHAASLVVSGIYTDNQSNLENFDYDNWGAGLGISWSM